MHKIIPAQLLPSRDVAIIYLLCPEATWATGRKKLQAAYAGNGGQRIRLDFFRYTESKYPFETWIYDGIGNRFTKIYPERRGNFSWQRRRQNPSPETSSTRRCEFTKQGITTAVAKQPLHELGDQVV